MRTLTFKALDELFLEIEQNALLLPLLKPTNLSEEKDKFFDSKYKYNPQFRYEIKDYSHYKKLLEGIEPIADSEYSELYIEKKHSLIQKINIIESVGNSDDLFIKLSQETYPTLQNTDLEISAQKIVLLKNKKEVEEYIEFDEIYELISKRLQDLNLDTQIVIKEEESMRFHVDHHNNKIFIPKGVKRTRDSINGMLMHEINVHLLRAENGKKMETGIFFLGTADYLPTEEGLASLMGYYARQNKIMRRPAMQYLVLQEAVRSDFKTSFDRLYKIIKKPMTCWNLTMRVKRGLMDTSKPGAFTKDQYFRWSNELGRKIIENPGIINYIFNGKASIETLLRYSKPLKTDLIALENIKNLFKLNMINIK